LWLPGRRKETDERLCVAVLENCEKSAMEKDDPFFGTNVETTHGMPYSDGSDTVFTSHDDGKSNGQ
jgi:hypothetical protein